MPRFYFDSQDGSFFRDEDGTDCSDLSEAKGVAARFVRELAYDAPPKMPFEVSSSFATSAAKTSPWRAPNSRCAINPRLL